MARPKGASTAPILERIKAHKEKLEKTLLDRALGGDVQAIEACLRLIKEQAGPEASASKRQKRKTPAADDPVAGVTTNQQH